ncbi:MAG TPA: serine/threonine-protein kinase, partial [Polyangiaceae bacterium]
GLHYAHELTNFDGSPLGIVHRDVSPSNVFLTYSGDVKLLDFGIAKSTGAISFTRDGIVKGKLGYASPEQCTGEPPADCRTDVYSVGVMMWEAIAGRKRSAGGTDASTFQARVQGTEQPIIAICPDVPRELAAICNRALARQPSDRFSSAQEFRVALERYLRSKKFEAGPEQLKDLMTKHFASEQRDIRRTIEEHLNAAHTRSSRPPQPSERMAAAAAITQIPRASKLPQIDGGQSLLDGLAPPSETPDWPAPRKKFPFVAGAGIVLGIAIATGWLLTGKRQETVHRPAPATSVAESHKDDNTNHPEGRPSAESVWVTLSAAPSAAELRLDGRRVSNPYRAAHGRDEISHHLTFSLNGYEALEREVWFAHDVELHLLLRAVSSADSAKPRHSIVARRAAASIPTVTPPPAVSASPPAAEPRPGDDLRGLDSRVTKARAIDETDPYKR